MPRGPGAARFALAASFWATVGLARTFLGFVKSGDEGKRSPFFLKIVPAARGSAVKNQMTAVKSQVTAVMSHMTTVRSYASVARAPDP